MSGFTGEGTHAEEHREGGNDELLKHARVSVQVGGSSAANVTHTWTTAFADANYTVSADIELDDDSNISAPDWYIRSVTSSATTVRVVNNSVTQQTFVVHLLAVHD